MMVLAIFDNILQNHFIHLEQVQLHIELYILLTCLFVFLFYLFFIIITFIFFLHLLISYFRIGIIQWYDLLFNFFMWPFFLCISRIKMILWVRLRFFESKLVIRSLVLSMIDRTQRTIYGRSHWALDLFL